MVSSICAIYPLRNNIGTEKAWELESSDAETLKEPNLNLIKDIYSSKGAFAESSDIETSDMSGLSSLRYIGNKPTSSAVFQEANSFSDTSIEAKKVFANDHVTRGEVYSMRPDFKPGFTPNPYLTGEIEKNYRHRYRFLVNKVINLSVFLNVR